MSASTGPRITAAHALGLERLQLLASTLGDRGGDRHEDRGAVAHAAAAQAVSLMQRSLEQLEPDASPLEAVRMTEQAITQAWRSGDGRLLRVTLAHLGCVLAALHQLDAAEELWRHCEDWLAGPAAGPDEAFVAAVDTLRCTVALARIARTAVLELGGHGGPDADAARAELAASTLMRTRRVVDIATRLGLPMHAARGRAMTVEALCNLGRLAEARAALAELRATGGDDDPPRRERVLPQALLALAEGRPRRALRLLGAVGDIEGRASQRPGVALAWRAVARAKAGMHGEALQGLHHYWALQLEFRCARHGLHEDILQARQRSDYERLADRVGERLQGELTALRASVDDGGGADTAQGDHLRERVRGHVAGAAACTDDLLELARLYVNAGDYLMPLDICDALLAAEDSYAASATARAAVRLALPQRSPAMLLGDWASIVRMLTHLFAWSARAADDGSIDVALRQQGLSLEVAIRHRGAAPSLAVLLTGALGAGAIGLGQADGGPAGLEEIVYAQQVVRLHRGRLHTVATGEGTEVRIVLPCCAAPAD